MNRFFWLMVLGYGLMFATGQPAFALLSLVSFRAMLFWLVGWRSLFIYWFFDIGALIVLIAFLMGYTGK